MTSRARPTLSFIFCLTIACGGGAATNGSGTTGASARVAPIPEGYHALTPALVVLDVDASLAFYAAAFGAEETLRVAGPDGGLMHAEMRIGDSLVMLGPENVEHHERAPVSAGGSTGALFVYVDDVDAAIAQAVAAGAELIMPATDMFWGDRYGQVRDRNGHRWSIATHTTDLTPDELSARSRAFGEAMAAGSPPPALTGGTPSAVRRPEDYPTVTPMLTVTGPEAIEFYVRAFGGTETERDLRPDGTLMHAEVRIGDSVLMLSGESPEEADVRTPANLGASTLTLMHYVPDADASFTRAVEAGASSVMPPSEMFWGDRFGAVADPSGQGWGLATHVRDVSPAEMAEAIAAMGN